MSRPVNLTTKRVLATVQEFGISEDRFFRVYDSKKMRNRVDIDDPEVVQAVDEYFGDLDLTKLRETLGVKQDVTALSVAARIRIQRRNEKEHLEAMREAVKK